MRKPTTTQALTPSIFDRLLDYDPTQKVEPQANRSQVIRELRESVRRDLEFLLNTRQSCGLMSGRACVRLSLKLFLNSCAVLGGISISTIYQTAIELLKFPVAHL